MKIIGKKPQWTPGAPSGIFHQDRQSNVELQACKPNWGLLAFLPAAILGAVAEKYFELRSQKKRATQAQAAQPQQPATQADKAGESISEGSCG